MKLPSRIVDISSPLENETVYDPPFMRPKIEYLSHKDTAPMICEIFPGLRPEDLPDGEGWAYEHVELKTHNGTHMDAPMTSSRSQSTASEDRHRRSAARLVLPPRRQTVFASPTAMW